MMLASFIQPLPPHISPPAATTHHVNVGDMPLEEEEEYGMDQGEDA